MYRLVGVTVEKKRRLIKRYGLFVTVSIPMEALPIPYSLTDFGRAFLATEVSTVRVADLDAVVPINTGKQWRRQAPRRSR